MTANRRSEPANKWPKKDTRGGNPADRSSFGAGTEGLCHTMPELCAMPFKHDAARRRGVVRLISADGGGALSIELQDGVNRIGRQRTDNDIVLVSPQVSRFHAEVEVGEEGIVVRDLGSANGTFVNGERIQEQLIRAGDVVGFSDQFSLRLLIDIGLEEPGRMMLPRSVDGDELPHTNPAQGPLLTVDSIPDSLEERSRRLSRAQAADQTTSGRTPIGRQPDPRQSPARTGGAAAPAQRARPMPRVPLPGAPAPAGRRAGGARAPRSAGPPAPPAPAPAPAPVSVAAAAVSAPGAEAARPWASDEDEVSVLERERKQLATLFQISKRCMSAQSLAELDSLLINVLERTIAFNRGFATYQLPSGDWKLIMSPKGDRWDRRAVRDLLQASLKTTGVLVVHDSQADPRLGVPEQGTDQRLLLPLRTRDSPVGTIFLICTAPDAMGPQIVDFLSLFADIAALAIVNCARAERGR